MTKALITDFRANGGQVTTGPFAGRPVLLLTTAGAPQSSPFLPGRGGQTPPPARSHGTGGFHQPSVLKQVGASYSQRNDRAEIARQTTSQPVRIARSTPSGATCVPLTMTCRSASPR